MNSKITINSQPLTTEPKKQNKTKQKTKQTEQEQNHRNGDPMEGYQQGREGMWEKGTGNKYNW